MDWEKQDNELRKLLEANQFLPENEVWDTKTAWQKLRKRNTADAPGKTRRWLPLAIAASVVGLTGLLTWVWLAIPAQPEWQVTQQPQTPTWQPHDQANRAGIRAPQDAGRETTHPLTESAAVATQKGRKTSREQGQGHQQIPALTVSQPSLEAITLTNKPLPTEITALVGNQAATVPPKDAGEPALVTPAPPTQAVASATPHKKTVRVVHYNTLLAQDAIAPPVFAQRSRREAQAMDNPVAQNEPATTRILKIELNPLAKKTP